MIVIAAWFFVVALIGMTIPDQQADGAVTHPASLGHPAANIPPVPSLTAPGDNCYAGGAQSPIESWVCIKDALAAINRARAMEGVGPMSLPTDFTSLNQAQQLYTVVQDERIDRGLPFFAGMCTVCDQLSQLATTSGGDPYFSVFPPGVWQFSSDAGTSQANALVVDYYWMYDDGWGGSSSTTMNQTCSGPTDPSCWLHRDNILTGCPNCTLYFGGAQGTAYGSLSFAIMLVGYDYSVSPPTDPTPPPSWLIGSCSIPTSWTGYRVVAWPGGMRATGSLPSCGSIDLFPHSRSPIIATGNDGSGGGYYQFAADGSVYPFGDAWLLPLSNPWFILFSDAVSATTTARGHGYWLLGSDGRIAGYGNATDYGYVINSAGRPPAVAIVSTADGHGFWVVRAQGRVFPFGDAALYPENGSTAVSGSVIAMARTMDGKGYWLLTSSGQVIGFGDARSAGPVSLSEGEPRGITASQTGGYWVLTQSGRVFPFGGARQRWNGPTGARGIAS